MHRAICEGAPVGDRDRFPPSQPMNTEIWTENRRRIHSWLVGSAPPLAKLYQGAVTLLFCTDLPWRTQFVAHAMREMGNRLPDYVGDPVTGQVQYVQLVGVVDQIWIRFGLDSRSGMSDGEHEADSLPYEAVSSDLLDAVQHLLNEHRKGRKRSSSKSERLFNAVAPQGQELGETLGPSRKQWKDLTTWAVGQAHKHSESLPYDQLLMKFETLESMLHLIAQPIFEGLDELDELLAEANCRTS